jgi:hypothetical protein
VESGIEGALEQVKLAEAALAKTFDDQVTMRRPFTKAREKDEIKVTFEQIRANTLDSKALVSKVSTRNMQ